MNKEEFLSIFGEAARGDQLSLRTLTDWLTDYGLARYAPLVRELADAEPAIPVDVQAQGPIHLVAAGTNWRIEYRPGTPTQQVEVPGRPDLDLGDGNEVQAEVRAGLVVDPLQLIPDDQAIRVGSLAPESVTPHWIRQAFDAARGNLVASHLACVDVVVVHFPGVGFVVSEALLEMVWSRLEWDRPGAG